MLLNVLHNQSTCLWKSIMVSVVVQCLLNCFHGATRRGTKKTSDRADDDDQGQLIMVMVTKMMITNGRNLIYDDYDIKSFNLRVPLLGGGGSLRRCATNGKRSTASKLTESCSGTGCTARPGPIITKAASMLSSRGS